MNSINSDISILNSSSPVPVQCGGRTLINFLIKTFKMFLENTSSLSSLGWNFYSVWRFVYRMLRKYGKKFNYRCGNTMASFWPSNVIVVQSNKVASGTAPGHNGPMEILPRPSWHGIYLHLVSLRLTMTSGNTVSF